MRISRPIRLPRRLARSVAAACAVALVGAVGAVRADELADKKVEKELEELRRDIEQAKADSAKAKLGSIDTTNLPKGKGEANDLKVEGAILAYRAVDVIAQRIATVTKEAMDGTAKPVVIYHERQLNAVMQYRAFQRQADLLEEALRAIGQKDGKIELPPLLSDDSACTKEQATKEPAAKGLSLALVDVALQVASLFKVDMKVSGNEVTVDEFALAMAVVQKLRTGPDAVKSVAYPASYLPGVFAAGADTFSKSPIIARLNDLAKVQNSLDQLVISIEVRRSDLARFLEGKPTPKCKSAYEADLKKLQAWDSKAKAVKSAAERMQSVALAIDEKTGSSGLQQLVVSEALASQFEGAYVLQLKPVVAGGATLTKTNLFSTRFLFSGGAIVSYLVFDGAGGQIKAAGTLPYYAGFIPAENLPAETPSR